MALPLIAALLYLLLSVHIYADVQLRVCGAQKRLCVTVRAWGLCVTVEGPVSMKLDREKAGAQGRKIRAAWPLVHAALEVIHWGQADVDVRIGSGDAALTAVASGTAGALLTAFQAFISTRCPCRVRIQPVFAGRHFALCARCIFSAAPGDIMFAVACAAVKKTQREGFSWLSTLSKA